MFYFLPASVLPHTMIPTLDELRVKYSLNFKNFMLEKDEIFFLDQKEFISSNEYKNICFKAPAQVPLMSKSSLKYCLS